MKKMSRDELEIMFPCSKPYRKSKRKRILEHPTKKPFDFVKSKRSRKIAKQSRRINRK